MTWEAITSVGFRDTQREAADRGLLMPAPLEKLGWSRPSTAAAKAILDRLRQRNDELGSPPRPVSVGDKCEVVSAMSRAQAQAARPELDDKCVQIVSQVLLTN